MRYLVIALAFLLQSVALAGDPETKHASDIDGLEFRGYFVLKDSVFVSLSFKGIEPRWLTVNDTYAGFQLLRFDQEEKSLALRDRDQVEHTLYLAESKILSATKGNSSTGKAIRFSRTPATSESEPDHPLYPPKDSIRSREGLNWDWIQSPANPMENMPIQIPLEQLMEDWKGYSEEERAAFVEVYRQCGWDITVIDNGRGANYHKIRGSIDMSRVPPPPKS